MMKKISTLLVAAACSAFTVSCLAADSYVRPMPTSPIKAGPVTVLGSEKPVIAVPLVAQTRDNILKEAKTVASLNPDMVEVRSDFWDFIEDPKASIAMLREIRSVIGEIPILLTCRVAAERGHKMVTDKAKFDFYDLAIKEKLPNLIDVELVYGKEFLQSFKKKLEGSRVALVVAYHDLNATPTQEEIVKIMEREIDAGADVAKIVVKPNSEADVLTFLNGTLAFRQAHPQYPIIASGSGSIGRVTRLVGGLFGIDLTFAAGVKGSNVSQLPVAVVKDSLEVIYPSNK